MMQYVQNAVNLVKFPLNRLKEDRFTAGIVTNQEIDSKTIKLNGIVYNFFILFYKFKLLKSKKSKRLLQHKQKKHQ